LDQNLDLSDSDREKAEHILSALEEHHGVENVPSKDQSSQLKELHKLAGNLGKPYKATDEEGESSGGGTTYHGRKGSVLGYLADSVRSGVAGSAGLAAAATSPYGAGRVGQETVNYGIQGAVSVGHKLLHEAETGPSVKLPNSDSGNTDTTKQPDTSAQKEQQESQAARSEKQAMAAQQGTGGSA
jgi:type IV secretory pathway VirJ component